jgi:hypothetical protein
LPLIPSLLFSCSPPPAFGPFSSSSLSAPVPLGRGSSAFLFFFCRPSFLVGFFPGLARWHPGKSLGE